MPDEKKNPNVSFNPSNTREDRKDNESLDQETLDQIVADSRSPGEEDEDQLESLLTDLGDSSDEAQDNVEVNEDDMDHMEALLDQLEADDRSDGAESVQEENAGRETPDEESFDLLLKKPGNTEEDTENIKTLRQVGVEETEADEDLDSLLADLDTESEEVGEGGEEAAEGEEEDLDSLLADLDTGIEENIDDTVVLEPDEDTIVLEPDDMTLEAEEDEGLDSLLKDLDAGAEDQDTDLKVDGEEDVAHILATGQAAPSSQGGEEDLMDDDILDDFKSVQEAIPVDADTDLQPEVATILFVDDAPDNQQMFQNALLDGAYDFVERESVEDALDALHARNVNLIFLNLDLTSDDPFEFLQRVTSDPDLPSIPIIVSSTQNGLIERALRMGAADYFVLPLGVMDLEFQVPRKVSNLLKLRKAERLLASAENRSATVVSPGPSDTRGGQEESKSFDELLGEDDQPLPGDILAGIKTARQSEKAADAIKRDKGSKKRLVPVSDQERIRIEHKISRPKKQSRVSLFLGISFLLIIAIGISALATRYFMEWKQQNQIAERAPSPPRPLPVLKPPAVPQGDYEMSRRRVRRLDAYQRQAEIAKTRIRQTVQVLSESGGAWWSPWRVIRETGGSLNRLVNRRKVSDILDVFGVDMGAVERGLQSQGTLDFLAGVGFDLHGKRAGDLSAREAFELLSARQIKDTDQIVNILSDLQDRLARDRAAQAKRRARQKRSSESAAYFAVPRQTPILSVTALAAATVPMACPDCSTAVLAGEVRGRPPGDATASRHPPGLICSLSIS